MANFNDLAKLVSEYKKYDYYNESNLRDKAIKFHYEQQNKKNLKTTIKNLWQNAASKMKPHTFKEIQLNDKEYESVKRNYKIISDTESYPRYKVAFKMLLSKFSIPDGSIIEKLVLGPGDPYCKKNKWTTDDGKHICVLRYASGKEKVVVPAGSTLVHMSPNPDIKELKPTFRSKTKGKYLYASNRVFFSIAKEVKATKAGLEKAGKLYRYVPTIPINAAFIDQSYQEYSTGYVFVETNVPIPVKRDDKE